MADWITTLDGLPGLSAAEKGKARVLLLRKSQEDASLLVSGVPDVAAEAIKEILRQETSAAGLGVGSAAGTGAAAGVGTTRAGDAGAAAGLGVGSVAGAGSLPAATGGASSQPAYVTRVMSSLEGIQATLTNLVLSVPKVTVSPSSCSSGQRKQIEEAVGVRFDYVTAVHAPCCCGFVKPCSPQSRFSWGNAHEDAPDTIARAVRHLESIAPAGVMVLPVQAIEWLEAAVLCGDTTVVIKTSKTDYIFVPQPTWQACQKQFGAELYEGWQLRVKAGTTTDALLLVLGSVIGLYEAKTEKRLNEGLLRVRAQALLEYLAVNQMKGWPTDDVIVLFGDLNRHYAVHAGRKDAGAPKRSIHVAGPAQLSAVPEGSASTAVDRSPESSTLGFIQALLETSRIYEAGGSSGGAASGRGPGATGNDEGGAGSGGGGAANSRREGATGNDEGGAGSRGEGAANSRGEGAHSSGGGASGGRGTGAGGGSGGSDAANSRAGAGSGGGRERSCSSGADSSDGSDGRESFDGDEGVLEAARDNASAQAYMSLLQLPEVYEPLGFKEPPKSFRPPTTEELLARFQPFEG